MVQLKKLYCEVKTFSVLSESRQCFYYAHLKHVLRTKQSLSILSLLLSCVIASKWILLRNYLIVTGCTVYIRRFFVLYNIHILYLHVYVEIKEYEEGSLANCLAHFMH